MGRVEHNSAVGGKKGSGGSDGLGIGGGVYNLGSFAFVQVVSYLVDWGGWDLALAVFAGMHLAAAACWLLLNPNIVIGENAVDPRPIRKD